MRRKIQRASEHELLVRLNGPRTSQRTRWNWLFELRTEWYVEPRFQSLPFE